MLLSRGLGVVRRQRGPAAEVAAGGTHLAHSGIAQEIIVPIAPDGRIETTIEVFQIEVMPRVRQELAQ